MECDRNSCQKNTFYKILDKIWEVTMTPVDHSVPSAADSYLKHSPSTDLFTLGVNFQSYIIHPNGQKYDIHQLTARTQNFVVFLLLFGYV